MVLTLDQKDTEYPFSKKSYQEVDTKNSININVFGYENKQAYPVKITIKKNEKRNHIQLNYFKDHIEILLLRDEDKS